jgi:hypothetical protein
MAMMCAINLQSQPFVSATSSTIGQRFSIGWLGRKSGIEINTGYSIPLLRADLPRIFNFSVGKKLVLSHGNDQSLNLTPGIGLAHYSAEDFSAYEKDQVYGIIAEVNGFRPVYTLELGKDWNIGRLFLSGGYCKKGFAGIGIRAFFK